jgi:phosphoglycerate dehydrogenase-like enzyme
VSAGERVAPSLSFVLPERVRESVGVLPGPARWYPTIEAIPGLAAEAEVVWAGTYMRAEIAAELLEQAPRLRWLHYSSTGVEHLPLAQFEERSVVLTNGAGLYAAPIAEHVVMCMLAARRNLPGLLRAQADGVWAPDVESDNELGGATVLILGYGQLGRAIARRLRGFGVKVIAARRSGPVAPDDYVDDAGDWRLRLGDADFVVLTLPSTPETRSIVGAEELAAMKPDAWLVNVARGSLVDELSLVTALASGSLGGAVLDAFVNEPLPSEHALWRLDNVILSPHSSWRSWRLPERDLHLFLDNVGRFAAGKDLRNVVDPAAGY